MVQMFVRTVVRMRVIASYSLLFISILLNIFCPYFSILLDFIFPCATQTLFSFHLPPTHVATRRQNGSVSTFCRGLFSQFAYTIIGVYSDNQQPVRQSA